MKSTGIQTPTLAAYNPNFILAGMNAQVYGTSGSSTLVLVLEVPNYSTVLGSNHGAARARQEAGNALPPSLAKVRLGAARHPP
jgi:hypothetical protein